MYYLKLIISILALSSFTSCIDTETVIQNQNLDRATNTLNAIYAHYSADNPVLLLRENYPYDENLSKPFSYLWTYSGSIPAIIALYESSKDKKYIEMLEDKILPGLEMYYDISRSPSAYASYFNTAPASDRFYDDNIRLGIDFVDLYTLTQNSKYLDKAKVLWQFVETGVDSIQGRSVYWCEQSRESKNACSMQPSVFMP